MRTLRTQKKRRRFFRWELANWGCEGRRDAGPDQLCIEATARECRAAGLELGDGAEPGAGCIAKGYGLGKGLVDFAFRGHVSGNRSFLKRPSPH